MPSAIYSSSPMFLRRLGINRLWPTAPKIFIDLSAAKPTGFVTDVAEGTEYMSAGVPQLDKLENFAARGSKFRLVVTRSAEA